MASVLGILAATALYAFVLAVAMSLYKKGRPKNPNKITMVQCDLCAEKCTPNGRHFNKHNGTFWKHPVHLYRHHRKQPIIQGNFKERQAAIEKIRVRKELEFERKRLEDTVSEIMSVPIGEEFAKSLDIQAECDRLSA